MKLGTGPLGHLIGPVKNKPIELADGTILCPSSTEKIEDGNVYWQVHFEKSRDEGKTWEVIGAINDGVEFDAIQPSILTLSPGELLVLCRSREGAVTQSRSFDGGNSWSDMSASNLPNPNAGTDATTLQDGRHIIVYNHTNRGNAFPSGRNMLNISISEDGTTWKPVATLERKRGEYSYPSVMQAKDGMLHITYTYDRKSVRYVEIDPKDLK
jgi:predicted neuraminidase